MSDLGVHTDFLVSPAQVDREARAAGLKPPPKLSVSEWADEFFYLSAENSAQAGKWHTLPYQREILDAFSDPTVSHVSVMKSARVGYTLMISAVMGYYIHQASASIMMVQPTVEDAKGVSRETVGPVLRDVPVLAALIDDAASDDDATDTILMKSFPGGVLGIVGANSGTGFRRVSRKVVLLDEVDGYPISAGNDGDPVKLAEKRAEYFWDRKIGAGSTPLIEVTSRIARMFRLGDQRRYYVSCPHCGHEDFFVFSAREDGRGHVMRWPEGQPDEAYFGCSKNGCVIEHKDKVAMVERGRWIADAPSARADNRHVSFHIWAAYSYSPNASWGQLAREFLEAKAGGADTLRVFVNTVLGETWKEATDAPEWERLFERREHYPIATVPSERAKIVTVGIDVQKDRWVWEAVAWGPGKESWSVEIGVEIGNTANEDEWAKLDQIVARTYPVVGGDALPVTVVAVDSGFNTQMAYAWARRHPGRVLAVKGDDEGRAVLRSPTSVDLKLNGKVHRRGAKVWPVGVNVAKTELYGWLNLKRSGDTFPPGFCHFPEYGEDYFQQLTAEQQVTVKSKRGFSSIVWQIAHGRENHYLDARVYARAAAAYAGVDRLVRTGAAAVAAVQRVAPEPLRTVSSKVEHGAEQRVDGQADSRYPKRVMSSWVHRRRE